ncbi:MotE family protein [Ammoniphilus sp. CFH 90114]|uniref:MotE family protein n=1 Tax=Ammoniphilus sp. CFH 90114 TaxID=2493665 RepID=UPI00100DDC29|nr:hypothetical protein [Ammoniphilus sp. CFH 90114]RXT15117.1 hypothetical protein EIZ39_02600 [Ammoniphilus sp. CFH 90114]
MEETVEERKYGKLEWFFYIIFLPLLFTAVLTGLLLNLLGYDILNKVLTVGNKIPYVEKYLPDPSTGNEDEQGSAQPDYQLQVAQLTEEVAALNEEIQRKQTEIEDIKKEYESNDDQVKKLKDEIVNLQKQLEDKRVSNEERQAKMKELAKLYTTMSASKAAPIMENLSLEEAVLVLGTMKPNERAGIVAKMNPQKAAELTILLKDIELSENDEIAALQQRIQALTKALSEVEKTRRDIEEIVKSFSVMNPASVADILIKMQEQEEEKVLAILAKMTNQQRGQIIENLNEKNPELAVRLTSKVIED